VIGAKKQYIPLASASAALAIAQICMVIRIILG